MFNFVILDKDGRKIFKFRAKEILNVDIDDDYVLSLSREKDDHEKSQPMAGEFNMKISPSDREVSQEG